MSDSEYIGSELEIFQHAVNWKSYYGAIIRPYLGAEVLEVGAGIGSTTEVLISEQQKRWVCLEPDGLLVEQISTKIGGGRLPATCEARVGTLDDLEGSSFFDSIVYIDVLEHIEDDSGELERAAKHLKPGGHLIVLSPAHQFLYTPFDKAIGHFRRYSKADLKALASGLELTLERALYLDSVGTLASLANKMLLRSSKPTYAQIGFWDTVLVPASRVADILTLNLIGKSVVAIWKRS